MKIINQQLIRNHEIQTSYKVVAEALGLANATYIKFLIELESLCEDNRYDRNLV